MPSCPTIICNLCKYNFYSDVERLHYYDNNFKRPVYMHLTVADINILVATRNQTRSLNEYRSDHVHWILIITVDTCYRIQFF